MLVLAGFFHSSFFVLCLISRCHWWSAGCSINRVYGQFGKHNCKRILGMYLIESISIPVYDNGLEDIYIQALKSLAIWNVGGYGVEMGISSWVARHKEEKREIEEESNIGLFFWHSKSKKEELIISIYRMIPINYSGIVTQPTNLRTNTNITN